MGVPLFGQEHVDRYRETYGEEGHDWKGTTVLLPANHRAQFGCQADHHADLPTARGRLPSGGLQRRRRSTGLVPQPSRRSDRQDPPVSTGLYVMRRRDDNALEIREEIEPTRPENAQPEDVNEMIDTFLGRDLDLRNEFGRWIGRLRAVLRLTCAALP
jgi:hypothetical protein